MAAENDRSGEDVWQQHFHPPPDSARSQSTRLPPRRPRDGYDYRRPAILSSANDVVIDLTNEPESPPQEHTASFPGPLQTPHPHRPRLRFPRDIMNQTSPVADHPPVIDLEAEPSSGPVDVSSSSGDVLYIGTSSVRPGPIEPRWLDNNGMPMHYRRHAQRPRGLQHGPSRRVLRGPLYPTDDDAISIMSSLPGRLNYGIPAFPYQPPSQSVSRGRQNLYRSPSPPKEGFTRIMGEENMATCPNCQGELGAGEGLKQEVYIAKPCGHVSTVHLKLKISFNKTNNICRHIVASVLRIEPSQSPKRQLQRPNLSPNARSKGAINPSFPPRLCTTFSYDIHHGHRFPGHSFASWCYGHLTSLFSRYPNAWNWQALAGNDLYAITI